MRTPLFITFLVIILSISTCANSTGVKRKRLILDRVVGGVGGLLGGLAGGSGGGRRPYGGYGGGQHSGSNAQASSYNRKIGGCILFNLACLGAGSSGASANADSNSYGGGAGGSGAGAGASSSDYGSQAFANGGGWNFGK